MMPSIKARTLALAGALAASLATGGRAAAAGSDTPAWWDPAWQNRLIIATVEPELAGQINTARVLLQKGEPVHAAGQDVRVVDDRLGTVPHVVVPQQDGTLAVEFCVENAVSDRYCVYFNNPDAPAAVHKWHKRAGGLYLETRPLQPKWRQNASNLGYMQKAIGACTAVYGKKLWPRINDTHNPFGSDDLYLSVYSGDLFCPETGQYGFATDSDDSSFLLINDSLVAQWPGGHVPSQTWEHQGTINLTRGIHKITYYHVETYGGQLCRAGWKRPSDEHFSVIPAKAFVRELPTLTMARQERAEPLNAFFEFEEAGALRLGSDEYIFPAVQFRSRATSFLGKVVSHYWEFGDGSVSEDTHPKHEYAAKGTYQVKLTVRDTLGFEDAVTRTVTAAAEDVRNVVLFFDMQKSATILEPGHALSVVLRFRSQIGPIRLDLRSVFTSVSGRLLEDTSESMELRAGEWYTTRRTYQPGVTQHSALLRLSYGGRAVRDRTIDMVPTRSPYGPLRVDNENLVSPDGHIVVLKLDEAPLRRGDVGRRFRAGERPLRVLVIDDSLSPAATGGTVANTYYGMLAKFIEQGPPGTKVDLRRVGRYPQSSGYLPLVRLSRLSEDVIAQRPDVVLLVCSISDILNYLPEHTFEAFLKASLDQILSQTQADVFLITPPPLAVNKFISKPYAMAAKRVAQRRAVPTVDLYSLFFLREKELLSFYQDEVDPDPVFYLEPNPKGQRLVARELYRTMYGGRDQYAAK